MSHFVEEHVFECWEHVCPSLNMTVSLKVNMITSLYMRMGVLEHETGLRVHCLEYMSINVNKRVTE